MPKLACMNSSDWLRMSKPGWRPSEFIFALVAGPMPWNLPTGSASTNSDPNSGEGAALGLQHLADAG